MSATDQMRAMLDELMGTNRNGDKSSLRFDDYRVCRAFLLGCCPYSILKSTRAEVGDCPKIHDFALKADYEQASRSRQDYNFEYDAVNVLETFITECERKKEVAKRRLKENYEELCEIAAKKTKKINELTEEIGVRLTQAEEYANKGDVDESKRLIDEVDELKKKKAELEMQFKQTMPGFTYQQQQLRICDICLAHLGINDNDKRLVDHFGGRLHLGFIEIRNKLEVLKKRVKELREQRRIYRDGEKGSNLKMTNITSSRILDVDYDYKRSKSSSGYKSRSRSRSRSLNKNRKSNKSRHNSSSSPSPRRRHKKHKSKSRSRSTSRHNRKKHKRSTS